MSKIQVPKTINSQEFRECRNCGKAYKSFMVVGHNKICPYCTHASEFKPLPSELKLNTPESIKLAELMFSIGMLSNILESLLVGVENIVDISRDNNATAAIKANRELVKMYDRFIIDPDKFGDKYELLQKKLMQEIAKFAKNNVK